MSQALLSVQIKGEAFVLQPEQIMREVLPKVPALMNAGMLMIRDQARKNLQEPPAGIKYQSDVTGTLKRSIDVLPVVAVAQTLVGAIKADAKHAAALEYGRKPGKGLPSTDEPVDPYTYTVRTAHGTHERHGGGVVRRGKRKGKEMVVPVFAIDEWMRSPRTLGMKGDTLREKRARAWRGLKISSKIKKLGIAAREYMKRAVDQRGVDARDLTIRLTNQAIAEANRKVLPGVR